MSKENRVKEIAERYENYVRRIAHEVIKINDEYYYGKRFVAMPGSSLWIRLKIRLKNWWYS